MSEIVKKEVCKCENCGNEAEMVVTCSLPEVEVEEKDTVTSKPSGQETGSKKHVQGTATCSHCGNEADMWIDL
jgi:DNA-directed RNA polymerase subunit M/transcription elongation factor TFIIS